MHEIISGLAGKTVKIHDWVKHPQNDNFGGSDFIVEDWWDRVSGGSWMFAKGNPACQVFAVRTGFSDTPIPTDDEVLYGKTPNGLGHLVHVSEIVA